MKGTHLLLIVNTSTCCAKMELHLTNLVSCTVCYIENSMVLTTGLMFQGYHTLVPSINSLS